MFAYEPQPPPPKAKPAECESAVAEWSSAIQVYVHATRPKAADFVAQRQRPSEEGQEQEVSGAQCAEPIVAPTDPRVDELRREASEIELDDPGLELQSKAAPPAPPPDIDFQPEWGNEESEGEREEVQDAIERTLALAKRFAVKARGSNESAEEIARATDLLLRMRALLQEDTDSEADEAATAAGSLGADKSDLGNQTGMAASSSAATSQTMDASATWPHATDLMKEKGFQTLFEVKDGQNLVHLCCAESQKRSATAKVVSTHQVAFDGFVDFCYCMIARHCGEKPDGAIQEFRVAFEFVLMLLLLRVCQALRREARRCIAARSQTMQFYNQE